MPPSAQQLPETCAYRTLRADPAGSAVAAGGRRMLRSPRHLTRPFTAGPGAAALDRGGTAVSARVLFERAGTLMDKRSGGRCPGRRRRAAGGNDLRHSDAQPGPASSPPTPGATGPPSYRACVDVAGVGLSLVDTTRREILYATVMGVRAAIEDTDADRVVDVTLHTYAAPRTGRPRRQTQYRTGPGPDREPSL